MRKKMLFAVFSVLVILAVAVSPVGAITNDQPDGNNYPYVGIALGPATGCGFGVCSAAAISPTGDSPKDTLNDKGLPPNKPIKDPLPDNPDDDKQVDDQKVDDQKDADQKDADQKDDDQKDDDQKDDDQKDDDQKVD